MIKIENLSKKFDMLEALKSVNISVEKGQIYGLVGTNGSGKTTLLKHIMKIYHQDTGNIFYKDQDISKSDDHKSEFYYIQDDLFFPHNYCLDDLFTYEKMLYPKMSEEKYKKLVAYFNIDKNKKLRSLSKGQKKQASFIIAVAASTKMILLDEIVDGLDPVIRKKFWSVIMTEVMDKDTTVIISSHALRELDNICDKVGMLHEGVIVKEEMINTLKEETVRVQFAINDAYEALHSEDYKVLKLSKIGKVYFAVLKGNADLYKKDLYGKYEVLLFEKITMNLEEIFISELGGLGYEVNEYDA